MANIKLSEGGAIIKDFENLIRDLPPPPCSCQSPFLRRVIWAFKMVDIMRLARCFNDPVILAMEFRVQGTRLFMVTSRKHVFHYLCYLRIRRPQYRTWNEIFSDFTPLRLYFDIDFYYATNPDVDANFLIDEFRRLIVQLLTERYQWRDGEEKKLKFVELDATTEEKFSRHLILHMYDASDKEITFNNATEIRDFVQDRVIPALDKRVFFIRPKSAGQDESSMVPFIDMSVYGDKAGQNFRLLGSPKFGRQNVLRFIDLNDQHRFQFHDSTCTVCKGTFLDSLVTASTKPQRVDNSIWRDFVEGCRRNFRSIDRITDTFGLKFAFYYEIGLLNDAEKLSRGTILGNLLGDVRREIHRSELYDNFPRQEKIVGLLRVCENFRGVLNVDPVDWDAVWGYAADILEFFEALGGNDQTLEETPDADGRIADPTTVRRLRVLYCKFSKWKQTSPLGFYEKYFEQAKKMYDAYLETLMSSKRSIVPDAFPATLERNNFPRVYDLLEEMERWELERRSFKKTALERKQLEIESCLRRRVQEEQEFLSFVEGVGLASLGLESGILYATAWATYLIDQFQGRITRIENAKAAYAAPVSASVEDGDQD